MKRLRNRQRIIGILGLGILLFSYTISYGQIQPEVFVQIGHSQEITVARFSPDGKYILSASDDATIKIWNFETGKEVRTFTGHAGSVKAAAFFPDGRYIVSGGLDKTVRVWDIQTGKRVRTWLTYSDVLSVAISPDGGYIASGDKNGDIQIWTLQERNSIRTLDHGHEITALDFSPDGKYLAVANGGEYKGNFQIQLWDTTSWKLIQTFDGHSGGINSLRFSPDGTQLISTSSRDNTLRIWDVKTGKQLSKASGMYEDASFSPDGRYIVGAVSSSLKLWDSLTGTLIYTADYPELKTYHIKRVSFSPDSRHIVYCDSMAPYFLGVFSLRSRKIVQSFSGEVERITEVFFSADQKKIFALSGSRIQSWDISQLSNSKLWTPFDNLRFLEGFTLSPKGTYLACTNWGSIFLLNQNTGKVERKYGGEGMVSFLRFTPDEQWILVGRNNQKGTVEVWDRTSGKLLRTIPTNFWGMNVFAVSPSGTHLLVGKSRIVLFDLFTGTKVKEFEGHSNSTQAAVYSPDGRVLITGGGDEAIKIWDITSCTLIRTLLGHTGSIHALQITSDGKYLVSAGSDKTIRIWDLDRGTEIRTLKGHTSAVCTLALSKAGDWILSGSMDGTIRLWDFSTGAEKVQFVFFLNQEWIALTPEGYFDASKNGAKYLNVRIGNTLYSMDNFYETFYHPLAVAFLLEGREVPRTADMRKGIAPPPEVRILQPTPNTITQEEKVTVVIQAKDLGGGIGEIRLFHNGKIVGESTRGLQVTARTDEMRLEFTLPLVEGLNTFRAVAFSKDRIESLPAEVQIRCEGSLKETTLHLFAVGVNHYRNASLNLNYAEPDARSIVTFFRKEKRLFHEVRVKELYNQEATKANILNQLEALQKTSSQDAVIIYLAGHGEVSKDIWYFLPHEVIYPEREEEIKEKGISSSELASVLKRIPAQKVLMLIDTCKAGGALLAFRGYEDRRALQQLSRSTGIHIIAASTKEQYASEIADLQHGAFTYTILEGLGGKAATSSKTITARSLMAYVENQLPEITRKYYREAQYPVVDSRGMDFPLCVLP
ncbi:MAG: caspase family protein [Spirochaetes bacterium]|nr:caspase family protein [Spirochaetota bacterium]